MRTSQYVIVLFFCAHLISLKVIRAFPFHAPHRSRVGDWFGRPSNYFHGRGSGGSGRDLLSLVKTRVVAPQDGAQGDSNEENSRNDGNKNRTEVDASTMLSVNDVGLMRQDSGISDVGDGNSVTTGSITRIPTTKEDLNEMLQNGGNILDDQSPNSGKTLGHSKIDSNNKYFRMVEKLAPNEIMSKFSETAPSNIQEAVKSTIMNILGSLPQYALDASLITTNTKLANLMFQMQITGYMFKNAEYRMSFTRSLKGYPKLPSEAQIRDGNTTMTMSKGDLDKSPSLTDSRTSLVRTDGTGSSSISKGMIDVTGEVTVKDRETGKKITVPAKEVTEALGNEIEELRKELMELRKEKQEELRGNILTYIQALPEKELASLTSDMSDEAMEAIQLLVDSLMNKLELETGGQDMVIQQPVAALAQLCMWQLVVGYKLRELEALEKGVNLD